MKYTEAIQRIHRKRMNALKEVNDKLRAENERLKRQNEYYQTQFLQRHIKEILNLHAERYPFDGENGVENAKRYEFLKSFLSEYQLKISELQEIQKII